MNNYSGNSPRIAEMPGLNDDQRRVAAEIDTFLADPDKDCLILTGSAGTGKTHLMASIVRCLERQWRRYELMAPTGRAAKILGQRTGTTARTIHSLIYAFDHADVEEELISDNGECQLVFGQRKLADQPTDKMFIVDEASMISDKHSDNDFLKFGSGYLLKDLIEHCDFSHMSRRKLIFVGDWAQLPPVDMDYSPALDSDYLSETYRLRCVSVHLTQVVRQETGSLILKNAMDLRNSLETGRFNRLVIEIDQDTVSEIPVADLVEAWQSRNESMVHQTIIIAFSNHKVHQYNQTIRGHLWGDEKTLLQPGERLILNKNVYWEGRLHLNGAFANVVAVSPEPETRKILLKSKQGPSEQTLVFRQVSLVFDGEENLPPTECLINETLLNSPVRSLTPQQVRASYVDFWRRHPQIRKNRPLIAEAMLADPWLNAYQMKYGYAITCHKAQGGEWNRVLVDLHTGQGVDNPKAFRWMYTALSRAKSQLYVMNPPRFSLEEDIASLFTLPVGEPVQQEEEKPVPPAWEPYPAGAWHLFQAVEGRLHQSTFHIDRVSHHQYQEMYHVMHTTSKAIYPVAFYYNKRFKITRVLYPSNIPSSLGQELTALLKGVEGACYSPAGAAIPQKVDTKNVHETETARQIVYGIQKECEATGQVIEEISYHQYLVKCILRSGSKRVRRDIYYNKKSHVTHAKDTLL